MPAAKITCLEDILGRPMDPAEVIHAIAEGFTHPLGVKLLPDSLTADEVSAARSLMDKYEPRTLFGALQQIGD